MSTVILQRIERFLRTQQGAHWPLLKKEFHYLHREQIREPGKAVRWVHKPTDLYAIDGDWMYFPCGLFDRCMALLAKNGFQPQFTDLRSKILATPSTSKLTNLRPGQLEVLEAIAKADMGIVDALTGFGKGVLVEKVVELYPKQTHAVITKSKSVCNMLHQRLKARFPKAGVWNSDKHLEGNPIVCTSGSLGHLELDKFDVVQLDEVHELLTPSFLQYYPKFSGCKMISYSASPDQRLDNTALAIEAYFGPRISVVEYQAGVDLGLVVPIEVWKVDWDTEPVDALSWFKSDVRKQRTAYWANMARNTAIAKVIYEVVPTKLAEKDPQILILVDKIEHALELKKQLPDFEVVYGNLDKETAAAFKKQGLLNEEPKTKKQVEELRKKFSAGEVKRAIATSIWSTGVDFPQLSVIVRADGGASTIKDIQMPGRVCRVSGDKEKGILVDFADRFDVWTYRRSSLRFKNYEERQWSIQPVKLQQ